VTQATCMGLPGPLACSTVGGLPDLECSLYRHKSLIKVGCAGGHVRNWTLPACNLCHCGLTRRRPVAPPWPRWECMLLNCLKIVTWFNATCPTT